MRSHGSLWVPIPIVVDDHLQAFWEEWGWKSSGNEFEEVWKEWIQEELVHNFARYFTDVSTMFVAMPNSLWHIDSHHKLIKWRIVIHGGIDGYSRLPVYLRASDNNRADTVLDCFIKAVSDYNVPSRVRCDKGGENVLVSEHNMLNHPMRGPGRRSCITGRSVHNQRIERLWRDVCWMCFLILWTL